MMTNKVRRATTTFLTWEFNGWNCFQTLTLKIMIGRPAVGVKNFPRETFAMWKEQYKKTVEKRRKFFAKIGMEI